jgi:hypothetical protein
MNFFLSHNPSFIEVSEKLNLRANEMICPTVASATEIVEPLGAFTTGIFFDVAASTSILSTPIPALPTTLSFLAL